MRSRWHAVRSAFMGACVFALVCAFTPTDAQAVFQVFNTGVDNTNTVLPDGSPEQHYTVSGQASSAFVLSTNLPAPWVAAPAGSAWIGPQGGNAGGSLGLYLYDFAFDLTGLDPSTAIMLGDWATDNDALLYLNGNATGYSKNLFGFQTLDPFQLNSGFVSGINTLEFQVNNQGGPTGLLVANLRASADLLPPNGTIPEPTTMALMGLGLLGLGARRRFIA